MTQPPKGPGALPLLLRLSMLRSRQRGAGSLAERGYSLAVALIASFVLLLGVGAIASRGQLGFIGQAFQVQNRQARDVAEAAIAEFQNTMNREPNRLILLAGNLPPGITSWADHWEASTNICTAFNADGTSETIEQDGNLVADVEPVEANISRFIPGETTVLGNGRSFTVQDVEYLTSDRQGFDSTTAVDGENLIANLRTGTTRTLIRVTVLGEVNRNGRISSARVAREFEVVPKCCKRSFGKNTAGGVNWGRDERTCFGFSSDPGIIAGLAGGKISGSGNQKPITQEDGSLLRTAACYSGSPSVDEDGNSEPSILGNASTKGCNAGTLRIGNPNQGAISFVPTDFSYIAPSYVNPNGAIVPSQFNVSGNRYIYFDPTVLDDPAYDPLDPTRPSGLVVRGPSSDPSTRARLDGEAVFAVAPATSATDICYTETNFNATNTPYWVVNCLIRNINIQGNSKLYIDTTSAKINIFFDDTYNGTYAVGTGNDELLRTHQFRTSLVSPGSNCLDLGGSIPDCLIKWPDVEEGTRVTQADRLGSFLELCTDRLAGCDDKAYAVRHLLNFYTLGNGSFNFSGVVAGVGFNIYAPNASVTFNGGGPATTTNFMGQIYTNALTLNGNITMNTFSSVTGDGQGFGGIPLVDFVARSFTQAFGF